MMQCPPAGFLMMRTVAIHGTFAFATSLAARAGPTAAATHQVCLQVRGQATQALLRGTAPAGACCVLPAATCCAPSLHVTLVNSCCAAVVLLRAR
jgi:hypothetical protein